MMQRTILWLAVLLCTAAGTAVATTGVKTGIDNLVDTDFALLKGKRVVLVSHAAARTRTGGSTMDAFRACSHVTLLRVLAPEHGFFGAMSAGEHIAADTVDGMEVASLYGAVRRPTAEMLADADVVVIDLQDIGVRSYTYISTMTEVLEACARYGKDAMVLDRPNPLGGGAVDGAVASDSLQSFVARLPIPYIHGMTLGELATMVNGEGWISSRIKLTVVKCKRWERSMSWEHTDLQWYPTSPNIPSVHAVRGYAVTGLLGELGGVSIGIGTTSPFTVLGAPSLPYDSALVATLATYGVQLRGTRFVPRQGRLSGQQCSGYVVSFTGGTGGTFRPYAAALTLVAEMHRAVPAIFADTVQNTPGGKMFTKVTSSASLLPALLAYPSRRWIEEFSSRGCAEFLKKRSRYLLYM